MKAVIGIDIGTQGTKAGVFAQNGAVLGSAFRKSNLYRPRPGVVEEDPEQQLSTVCQTISECMAQARLAREDIAAIAIDGQMAGVLGVGKDGRAVTPYDSWLDTRCAPYITIMNESAGDEILDRTGGPASFNHGPKVLWWMRERPKVFRSIASFVQPGGYAAMRLCGLSGKSAFIDTTYLHFSGFANNNGNCWDRDLCQRFKLDGAKLPRIVNPYEVVGELSGVMARRCRLRGGVPVVAGCGDTAASFLACGATRQGICVDVAGTASVFAAVTSSFRPDRLAKTLSCGRAVTPGLWHPYAYVNGGGMNLEWFRDHVASAGQLSLGKLKFAELDRKAASLPLSDGLPFFVPHLGGRVSPAWPRIRGAWVNLDWTHGAAHLWRAMLESIAFEYAIYKQALLSLCAGLHLGELRVTGGGEKSALWNQIKADVLKIPVVQVTRSEGAPMGAALLAAYAVGLVKDLDAGARQWVAAGTVTRPNSRAATRYEDRLRRYESLLRTLNSWPQGTSAKPQHPE